MFELYFLDIPLGELDVELETICCLSLLHSIDDRRLKVLHGGLLFRHHGSCTVRNLDNSQSDRLYNIIQFDLALKIFQLVRFGQFVKPCVVRPVGLVDSGIK